MNKLHFGDNLEILREMEDESVDLICTDPPINAGRNYNIFLHESFAYDIWTWDKTSEDARVDIEKRSTSCKIYRALNECLYGYDMMLRNSDSAMGAYLAFMGPRLAEMHRILSKAGSIYLHCDPTVSHYLKCVMDSIFGEENFKNEIVWCYKGFSREKQRFPRQHDIILFYGKSQNSYFNSDAARVSYTRRITGTGRSSLERGSRTSDEVIALEEAYSKRGKLVADYWDDINPTASTSIERLGYPTQKPRRLYERMLKTASNEGDLVLDPFCGGGTTLDAAQALKRHWVGIDITILALDPIKHRLEDRYGLKPSKDYKIEGYPTNMQDVQKLASDKTKHNEFSTWAVTRLGLKLAKDVDNDGHTVIWTPDAKDRSDVRVIAEVKASKPTSEQIRIFRKSIKDSKASMGIFITLEPVTSKMREIVEDMGKFEYKGLTYPKLQFWQITDTYFDDSETSNDFPQIPGLWRVRQTKKTERHFPDIQLELDMK